MQLRSFASALALTFLSAASMLAGEPPPVETISAFVREQSTSPVKWLAWGDEAFKRARQESKPLYVHIGAFTSELSRAMARQSFANADTAKFLNENFVCVLVDREEHPGLAALYRTYLRTTKQLEGWPLNVWLTPELKPMEGATYLPPSEEWGKPGFMVVAKQVASAWAADAAAQREKAEDAIATVQAGEELPAPPAVNAAELDRLIAEGTEAWRTRYDAAHGGFGEAPKLPEPELLRFLLRGSPAHREMALRTLGAMIDGGIRDQLDGGFFKQATDAAWRLPYFQKSISDQARLVLALLDAAKLTKDARYREAATRALGFVLMFLGDPRTGLAATQDATADTQAQAFFWTLEELQAVLGEREARNFARAFGVTAEGNIPADAYSGIEVAKRNILYRATPRNKSADPALGQSARKLLYLRRHRPGPRTDPTATAGAYGLILTAFARASVELPEPHFRTMADHTVAYIRKHLRTPDGGLLRMVGREVPAAPEDYAFVIDGLLALHEATNDQDALAYAKSLRAEADRQYFDAKTGRYFSLRGALAPGMWARVHAPVPAAGELPAAEAAMVIALTTHKSSADKPAAELTTLIAAIANEVRDSAEAPRGELLLALQSYRQKNP